MRGSGWLATIALLLAAAPAAGQQDRPPVVQPEKQVETPPGWWSGENALGRWGGLRDRLTELGLDVEGYYVNDLAGNPVGGRRRGVTDVHNLYASLRFDFEPLLGWHGAELTVSGIYRGGPSLSREYVGSQYNSQQVWGGQTYFLYGVFLDQHLWEDRISIKVGRFGASDDFNTSPLYGLYMNNGIDGNVRNVLFDTQFSAYPFATWAARVRFEPSPSFAARLGIFQTSDRVFDPERHGVDWSIRSGDGFFAIAQLSLTPDPFADPARPADEALVNSRRAHYWIGGSLSRWRYPQFGTDETARYSYGAFAHLDQLVFRERPESTEGLTLWSAAGLYPQRALSIVPFQLNVGASYKGLIPGRDADLAILGVIYGAFSSRYGRALVQQGATSLEPTHELVVEAAYRLGLRQFLYVQPDLQWIERPSGTGAIPNALVVGAQTGVLF